MIVSFPLRVKWLTSKQLHVHHATTALDFLEVKPDDKTSLTFTIGITTQPTIANPPCGFPVEQNNNLKQLYFCYDCLAIRLTLTFKNMA